MGNRNSTATAAATTPATSSTPNGKAVHTQTKTSDERTHSLSDSTSASSSNDSNEAAGASSSLRWWEFLAHGRWREWIPCMNTHADHVWQQDTINTPHKHEWQPAAVNGFDDSSLYQAMEQKHHAFWELVQHLLTLNDVFVMIRLLLEYMDTHMEAAKCAVFLIDQNANVMSRISRGHASVVGIEPGKGIVGYALQSKTPISLRNFKDHLIYDADIDLAQEFANQQLLCVPLVDNGNVYAIVQASSSIEQTNSVLDELDIKLLTWLGPILSPCMRKCIEFHDVLLSERTQKALLHIISSSDTEDTVLNLVDGVIAGACHITKAERLTLFMIDWENQELWALSSSYHDEHLRVPIQKSILGIAAKTRAVLTVNDPATDPRFHLDVDQRDGIETRCALYVPVGVQNPKATGSSRPIAVLEILNKEEAKEFTIDDECAFEAFASEVAVILRRRSNEIEYIKLLADTRAEKVLAQRAKSQVNLLECYTSYSSTVKGGHAADRLRHSFLKSHSHDCVVCNSDEEEPDPSTRRKGSSSHCMTPKRLGYKFQSRPETMALQPLSEGPRIPSWDFNVFTAPNESLLQLIEDIFMDFNVDEILKTDTLTMQNFIVATKEKYHPNPFHNFLHAVSVLHASYLLLSTTDAAQLLTPLDIAGCLVAAFCHDVDHPGHTNAFEIMSGSQLALLYSDESVLERHHAYTTFRILSKEKNANILQHLSTSDYRHIRKVIITAILGTDMANHFKFCEALEKILHPSSHQISSAIPKRDSKTMEISADNSVSHKSSQNATEILSVLREAVFQSEGGVMGIPTARTSSRSMVPNAPKSPRSSSSRAVMMNGWVFNGTLDDRLFLIKTIVHASDLSGQVFPKPVALKWSNMITKEFAYQALLEQAEGLPVSYQHLDDPLQMVEGQHFFAQKIVAPLWDLMYVMFPEVEPCLANLRANILHYELELERLTSTKRFQEEEEQCAQQQVEATTEQREGPRTRHWSIGLTREVSAETLEDEGLAVPGLARCTPAKFNSFRATRSVDDAESPVHSPAKRSSELLVDAIGSQVNSLTRLRSASSMSDASISSMEEEVEVVDVEFSHVFTEAASITEE